MPPRRTTQAAEHRIAADRLSVPADTVGRMSNAAPWAATAGNKFREAGRTTENPTTKLLAEGLTALTEALRELDAKLENIERQIRSDASAAR